MLCHSNPYYELWYYVHNDSARAGYSQLVVNGKILVKKDQASGKISVEGPLSQDFFTVRSVVCAQYVTL
jgi:hypothetical protein